MTKGKCDCLNMALRSCPNDSKIFFVVRQGIRLVGLDVCWPCFHKLQNHVSGRTFARIQLERIKQKAELKK